MASPPPVAPALEALRFLEGEWELELSDASFLPQGEVITAAATFEFVEGGRLLVQRQGEAATWMFGRDDSSPAYTVIYSDARGISRVYSMMLAGRVWKIWRDDPGFSQRFEAGIGADGDTISGSWEKRVRDGSWEHDFNVTYRRITD